jgi:hypothetical protein
MTYLAQEGSGLNSPYRFFRKRLIRANWIVVRQSDGYRRSIPVFIRRSTPRRMQQLVGDSLSGRCQ